MAGVTLVWERSSFWASVPVRCVLLGLGGGGIGVLSFLAVPLPGVSSGEEWSGPVAWRNQRC